ncbi:A24 family peptidase [uncultured Campylobacter sp.]|uniref:prepilin peptidase n=1 Tax=uncultured Campylobacter sp. TaxID=218934 RepID=UPI0026098513|nr:A24 family peptidase [uncultured Campylobacter sp.]
MSEQHLYWLFFILFGLCFGSFSNVLIYRLPEGKSINFPPSSCMNCKKRLKWYHNIPLFSWIALRGRCAYCKCHISFQYPLVELIGGLLMFCAYFYENSIIKGLLLGICFINLLSLSIIDLRYKAVPSSLLYLNLAIALLYGWSIDLILSAALFAALFFSLRVVVSFVIKQEAMGSADIDIAAIIGAILGIKLGFFAIYLAALLTLPAYLIVRKRGYELPFVPFLAAGLLLSYLFSSEILLLFEKLYG